MDLLSLVAKLSLDSSEYEKGLGDAETKGSTFGRGLKKAAVVGAGAVAAVGTAAIAAGTALVKGTANVAAYGDNIDKMSQKMGISAQAYQEWDAIMQHSGTSIDSMSRGMQTLQKNAIKSADKFEKLGISQEQLASMSTEDLFSATITGLQNMGEGAERTALASELLGGSAKELGALLNTSAEDTQAMRDRVHELGGVMSDDAVKAAAAYQDSLQDMRTGFDSLKRNMLSEFLPAITSVMDGLTNLFTGNYGEGIERISEGVGQAIDKLVSMIPTIIQTGIQVVKGFISGMAQTMPQIIETAKGVISNFAHGITTNLPAVIAKAQELITNFSGAVQNKLPQILAQGVAFVQNLVNGIVRGLPSFLDTAAQLIAGFLKVVINALPQILNAGMQILTAVVNGIVESLPEIIEAAGEIITSLLDTILDNLPEIIEGGLQMLEAIVQGIMDNLPEIISAIIEVVAKIVATIGEHLPEILQAGIDILEMLITGLINTIPDLVAAIPQIIRSIKDSFSQYDWGAIGSNIIDGIKNGISSAAGRIANAAKEAARKALDAAKDFLGIHSPSTVFRDQIGKYMALGMAEGFEDNIPVDGMQNSLDGMVDRMGNMVRGNMQFSTEGVNHGATYNGGITINVYGAEGQNVRELAREIEKIFTLQDNQRRAAYA